MVDNPKWQSEWSNGTSGSTLYVFVTACDEDGDDQAEAEADTLRVLRAAADQDRQVTLGFTRADGRAGRIARGSGMDAAEVLHLIEEKYAGSPWHYLADNGGYFSDFSGIVRCNITVLGALRI